MKLEFEITNLVVSVGVTEIIDAQNFFVDFVNNDLVVLTLLEVVLYVDALYPLWVEFANDGLCLSNFVPPVDVLGEEHSDSSSPREGAESWEVRSLETQVDNIHKAISCVDLIFYCPEHGIVEIFAYPVGTIADSMLVLTLTEARNGQSHSLVNNGKLSLILF